MDIITTGGSCELPLALHCVSHCANHNGAPGSPHACWAFLFTSSHPSPALTTLPSLCFQYWGGLLVPAGDSTPHGSQSACFDCWCWFNSWFNTFPNYDVQRCHVKQPPSSVEVLLSRNSNWRGKTSQKEGDVRRRLAREQCEETAHLIWLALHLVLHQEPSFSISHFSKCFSDVCGEEDILKDLCCFLHGK